MRSSGLIFDSNTGKLTGTVWLDLPPAPWQTRLKVYASGCKDPIFTNLGVIMVKIGSLHFAGLALRLVGNSLGNGLILIGAAGIVLTMLPVVAMEMNYYYETYVPQKLYESNQVRVVARPTAAPGPANEAEAFSVHIPKIDAHSKVIPNVDAGDPAEYSQALARGVAHAKGTGLPGVASQINRTIYLFAHSTSSPSLVTKYNAQFYLLNKMAAGDDIEITFWAKPYHYRVVEKKVTQPEDVSFLTRQTEREILVLATCTPPGTTYQRLLVIAERI